jgi:hypothetical protein
VADDEVVVAASFPTWLEASMWAERLRSEGIAVLMTAVGGGSAPYAADQLWPHELRVRSTDVERARDILAEAET